MINCAICGREFKNKRGFHTHLKKHKGEEGKSKREKERRDSVLGSILAYIPPTPIQKLELELSPEGYLKLSVKKELVGKEE